jgi:hypothetical protein
MFYPDKIEIKRVTSSHYEGFFTIEREDRSVDLIDYLKFLFLQKQVSWMASPCQIYFLIVSIGEEIKADGDFITFYIFGENRMGKGGR